MILKRLRKVSAVLLALFIAGNTGMLDAAALAAEGSAAGSTVSAASAASSIDLLDPDFVRSHGGNIVSVKADPNRSPFAVFGEAFRTDNPVEGVTNRVRAVRPTAVRHVENFTDPVLGNVFKVEAHDGLCADGCFMHNTTYDPVTDTFSGGNTDRQRIEIRPDDDHPELIGLENDITAYNWKLKLDKDLPKPDGFFHIFQYKAVNSLGEAIRDYPLHDKVNFPNFSSDEDGNPILTLTVSSSNLDFRWAGIGSDAGMEVLSSVPLTAIKDKWVEVTVKILNSECGWVTMTMKDVATGKILMEYNDPTRVLDMWRRPELKYDGKTFEGPYPAVSNMLNRPKWGIYRKAEKGSADVKGAKIYLSDINLYKCVVGASPVNLAYGKKAYNTGATSSNILQSRNAVPERLTDGVQTDPVIYPVTGLNVTEDNYASLLGRLCWIGTESSKKGNVIIDLGRKMDFNQVSLFAKSLRMKGVNIYTSSTEADYTAAELGTIEFTKVPDIVSGTGYTYFNPNNTGDDTKDAQYLIDLGKTYSSRYIKFFFENGSGSANATTMSGPPRISELEIYNAPQSPKNIKIDYSGGSEATISWDPVPADYFTLYEGGQIFADHVASNSYRLTQLDPGSTYNFSLKAVFTDPYSFKSMLSAEGKAAPLKTDGDPIIPNPPASVTVTAPSDKSIDVTWSAVPDAQNYKIVLVTDACERIIADGVVGTSYTIKDLSPGTSYTVKIHAVRKGIPSAAATGTVKTTGIRNSSDNLLFNREVQYPRVWNDNTASYGGQRALDNDVDGSRWVALKGSATSWLMVDIGEMTPVNVLEYYSFQNKLKKVSFYYATEGEAFTNPNSDKWIKILTDDRVADGRYGNPAITKIQESIALAAPVNARFIKFTVDAVDGDINVNEVKAFYRKAETPAANPKGGFVAAGTSVSLATNTSSASIYYTVDGSTPTVANAVYYTAPITIDKTLTIKAIAVKAGIADSEVMSESYTVDTTPPVITGAATTEPNVHGWYNSNVVVHFTAADEESGVATVTPDITLSTEGASQSVEGTAVDKAGNSASTTVKGINIDKTAPEITVNIADASTFLLNQKVVIQWTAADALSVVDSVYSPYLSGQAVDTKTPGKKTFTILATDKASNQARKEITYFVGYDYSGVLQPLNNDGSSVYTIGRDIPVKFRLKDAGGSYVGTAAAELYLVKPDGTEVKAQASGNSNLDNKFRYDAKDSQYLFNMTTRGLTPGVWKLKIVLDDGTAKLVQVTLNAASNSSAWSVGSKYKAGDKVYYADKEYVCIQGHTSQQDWTPNITLALWNQAPTLKDTTGVYYWEAQVYFQKGDVVYHEGSLYQCIQSHATQKGWEPASTPSLWKKK